MLYKDFSMKDILHNPAKLSKIEFWTITVIYIIAVFSLTTSNGSPNKYLFEEEGTPFYYYQDYFFPQFIRYTLLYGGLWFLNFRVVPKLIRKEALPQNIIFAIAIFLLIGLGFSITGTYLQNYLFNQYDDEQRTYNIIFQDNFRFAFWLLFMFGFYTVIKYTALYLLANSEDIQAKYRVISRDGLVAFVLWMISMFLLLVGKAEEELITLWGILVPYGILLYCYSFYLLIPSSLGKKKPFGTYIGKVTLLAAISILPIFLLVLLFTRSDDVAFAFSLLNVPVQAFLTAPLSWFLFKRHARGREEMFVLKQELGHTSANLDFLRSQINPHFLFNALNTLYGTALQENSERTAQGIQMLGDMMRFMLHENIQHKILLAREIEYMRNYIELQALRTSASPNIVIETKIEDVLEEKFIAPMLLIPFVENAFKHGISLTHKSWIKITLHYWQDKLYFDVYNSVQRKQEHDPEKNQSGVGLTNVKQRLALLYPNRHELVIRETAEEYFVHLTLQL